MSRGTRRLGAYVLAADPTWLRSSIAAYYDDLDALLISASATNRGWTGRPIRASECVRLAQSLDERGIVQVSPGNWQRRDRPLAMETVQRQAAVDELSAQVDWVLQIDSDEILPDLPALHRAIDEADRLGIDAVEWPMRVLFRRLRDGRYLQVVTADGAPHVEFPGPIAVRAGTRLTEARRAAGSFLRPHADVHSSSLQLRRPPEPGEVRVPMLSADVAILHNSWARRPAEMRAKVASWGHNQGWRSQRYYYGTWLPAPLQWRRMHDFHPFAHGLWPALAACDIDPALTRWGRRAVRTVGPLPLRRNAWHTRADSAGRGCVRGSAAPGCRPPGCRERRPS